MGHVGNEDPHGDGAGGGIVGRDFVVQFLQAGAIGPEDDVVAVGVLYFAAVGGVCQVAVGAGDQNREVGLVRVRNLGMVDDDGGGGSYSCWWPAG